MQPAPGPEGRVPPDWQDNTARQLGAYVDPAAIEAFKAVRAATVAAR